MSSIIPCLASVSLKLPRRSATSSQSYRPIGCVPHNTAQTDVDSQTDVTLQLDNVLPRGTHWPNPTDTAQMWSVHVLVSSYCVCFVQHVKYNNDHGYTKYRPTCWTSSLVGSKNKTFRNNYLAGHLQKNCKELWWACLFVCLSHISKTTQPNFSKFLCMLPVAVVGSPLAALQYVIRLLLVLWNCEWRHVFTQWSYGALCVFLSGEK